VRLVLFEDLEQDIAVAGLVGSAPARERLAGQLAAGGLGQFRMFGEMTAVERQGPEEAMLADAVGVAPLAGAGDDHRVRRLAPSVGTSELDAAWGGGGVAGAHRGASSGRLGGSAGS